PNSAPVPSALPQTLAASGTLWSAAPVLDRTPESRTASPPDAEIDHAARRPTSKCFRSLTSRQNRSRPLPGTPAPAARLASPTQLEYSESICPASGAPPRTFAAHLRERRS